jgi:outer membrane protein OmpA-like peptidoglycan-associated protein
MNLKYLLFFLIALAIAGCATSKLVNDPGLKSYIEINEGDEVALQWNFHYAEKVLVNGFERIFANNDYILDRPAKSREYILNVMNSSDTLVQTIYVKVKSKSDKDENVADTIAITKIVVPTETAKTDTIETKPEIRTGPNFLKDENRTASISESEYLNGQITADIHTGPALLKVMRTRLNEGSQFATLEVLLMDRFGNSISGLDKDREGLLWTATNTCGSLSANYSKLGFTENNHTSPTDFLDIGILIDNSAASTNNEVKKSIKEFLPELKSTDNVMISYFNQNYEPMLSLSPVVQTILGYEESFNLPKKSGLNALNKASFIALDQLSQGRSDNKALIIITYLSDNASLTYDGNDVVKLARMHNIPIYIIGIGEIVSGFELRYITSLSGGRYYFLLDDESSSLKNVLSEIAFAQRNHYDVYLPVQNFTKECSVRKADLSISLNDSIHSESVTFQNEYDVLYFTHQVMATFDEKSFNIKPDYEGVIISFANILNDNPDRPVQLVGYSWGEGGNELSTNMAVQRAETVKDLLIARGVSPNQIKIKNGGSDKPIYPNDNENWQKSINRRVEVRWLDPNLEPYEILTETADSEEDALLSVEKWEGRGYKSYYERSVNSETVKYRVKLWGYTTIEDAQKASEYIKVKYVQMSQVE